MRGLDSWSPAGVAQLVEHPICNRERRGSIPLSGSQAGSNTSAVATGRPPGSGMPKPARGRLRMRPPATSVAEPPPSRLSALARAERDQHLGELLERQPGLGARAAVAHDGEQDAVAADPERGARMALGGDVGVELPGAGAEALEVRRRGRRPPRPRGRAAARPAAGRRAAGRAARRGGRSGPRRRTWTQARRSSHGASKATRAAHDPARAQLAERLAGRAGEEAADERLAHPARPRTRRRAAARASARPAAGSPRRRGAPRGPSSARRRASWTRRRATCAGLRSGPGAGDGHPGEAYGVTPPWGEGSVSRRGFLPASSAAVPRGADGPPVLPPRRLRPRCANLARALPAARAGRSALSAARRRAGARRRADFYRGSTCVPST